LLLCTLAIAGATTPALTQGEQAKPLVIAEQGVFFSARTTPTTA
jgi:hypothetical protein